ncbi:FAD-binding dehydrogenase [Pseudogracilibacillus sp. ICA-222130]|uniref:FAD-binding dehydrogenase n=1 Tax=Pseudogracilibacillus sp. ICA-222130 TaxID=3134655 RepID=UPI0030C39938
MQYDVIVIGAGLAGLVTTTELATKGKKVLLLDQEGPQSLGGQAWWSFGGLFLVDSPEQRRMGIKDSHELAWQDWLGTASYDRLETEDKFGFEWAKRYVHFAKEEKRSWLHEKGVRFFPVVGWAERGGYLAEGHGNSVPRFHITWGTGPGLVQPFLSLLHKQIDANLVTYKPRHQEDYLMEREHQITTVQGSILENDHAERGKETTRKTIGEFSYEAASIVIASGGIGANFEAIRKNWPKSLGKAPKNMIAGVPKHVDGRMLSITERAGGKIVNRDRMWHYTEGIRNWAPIWEKHGIRILPGPSSLWLDAEGNRLEAPNFPGFDTLGTLKAIMDTGYDYSWFILTKDIIEKEFALSGSEQNPDLTGKSIAKVLQRILPGPPTPVQHFIDYGEDFIVADSIENLVVGMNKLIGHKKLSIEKVRKQVEARDRALMNNFTKDLQVVAMHGARNYIGDKLIRTAKPHRLLDPTYGPLIAVKLNILSRKTLGGLQTNMEGKVLQKNGIPFDNVYAAGEVAGFGGGGLHGYRSLEGTFLGGCLFTGKTVAESIIKNDH